MSLHYYFKPANKLPMAYKVGLPVSVLNKVNQTVLLHLNQAVACAVELGKASNGEIHDRREQHSPHSAPQVHSTPTCHLGFSHVTSLIVYLYDSKHNA